MGDFVKYDPFEYDVLKFIKKNQLILPGEKVVLAVSGGADSIAMMYTMAKLKAELKADFFVAHLNHMIRKEAEKEGPAVKTMAKKLGMPCLIGRKNVPLFHKKKRSLSLEEAARILRYEFFEEALETFQADKIATAHHLSDLTENFFIRLFRGSGVGGLIGMRPVNGKFIKPFLFLDEGSIREYVTIRRLEYFEDETNNDFKYLRNKIRHKLIPFIRSEFCPDIEKKVSRTVKILEGYQDFVRFNVEKILSRGREDDEGRLFFEIEEIGHEHLILEELTKEILRRNRVSISTVKIESVVNLVSKGSGEVKLAKNFFAVKYANTLFFGRKPSLKGWKGFELNVPASMKIEELSLSISVEKREYDGYVGDGKKMAVVDAKSVSYPLIVRMVGKNDVMIPLGMKKEKKVMSLLKSKKVPIFLREVYPVVTTSDGKILWVVGVGISEEFKVTSETGEVLVLGREGGNFF